MSFLYLQRLFELNVVQTFACFLPFSEMNFHN